MGESANAAKAMVVPLAMAQFVASYAGTNMNVAISAIADDLDTTVIGVQRTITLFTLTMASLMIIGSKLTDIAGRKVCFVAGLGVYGAGALIAAAAPGLGLLTVGYSLFEGVGSALMIPPIYILITVAFPDLKSRARYFGLVSGAAGLGAAAGPLIGGLITTSISWRASFVAQALMVGLVIVLSRKIVEPARTGDRPRLDVLGSVLSAVGLFFVVFGILQSGTYGWLKSREAFTIGDVELIPKGGISPVWIFVALGALILWSFFRHIRSVERSGGEPLLATRLFGNRTSNLGLITQTVQWLVLQGSFFVISVYLQQIWHYNAVQTGLMLTPATAGLLLASAAAGRMAARRPQRTLISGGFVIGIAGIGLVLALVRSDSGIITFVPGLLLVGIGLGIMLTASVNVVQSSFAADDQGDISGLSRSVSNLGSSLGTALVGSVLVAAASPGGRPFALSLVTLIVLALLGLVAALMLPRRPAPSTPAAGPGSAPQ